MSINKIKSLQPIEDKFIISSIRGSNPAFTAFKNEPEIARHAGNHPKYREGLAKILRENTISLGRFESRVRNKANWIESCGFPIDVDDGKTIAEAIEILENLDVQYILWPSKNHNKPKNGIVAERFHILIFTDEPIRDAGVYDRNVKHLIDLLGGDKQCPDVTRFFFPTPDLKSADVRYNFKAHGYKPKKKHLNAEQTKQTIQTPSIEKQEYSKDEKMAIILSAQQVTNLYPSMIPASVSGNSEITINYHRNQNDNNPRVFAPFNKPCLIDKGAGQKNKSLIFSTKDFLDVEVPDHQKMQKEISDAIRQRIQENKKADQSKTGSVTVLLANEGTGKSKCFSDEEALKDSLIIACETKKRMSEIIEIFKKFDLPELIPIPGNADLIYTCIYENRKGKNTKTAASQAKQLSDNYNRQFGEDGNDTQALETIKKANKEFENLTSEEILTIFTQKLNKYSEIQKDEFEEFEQIAKGKTDEEIKQIFDDNDDSRGSTLSLFAFLENMVDTEKIHPEEAQYIIQEHVRAITRFIKGGGIIITTSTKYKMLMRTHGKKAEISETGRHIFFDEYSDNTFNKARVMTGKERYIDCALAYAQAKEVAEKTGQNFEEIIEKVLNEKQKRIIKALKIRYNITDWGYVTSFNGRHKALTEFRDLPWLRKPGFHYYILGTEESIPKKLCKYVTHELDFSHKMLDKKISYVGMRSLSSRKNENRQLQGTERLLAVKKMVMDQLGVREENYIAESVGHNKDSDLPNHTNIKGSNLFRERIEKEAAKTGKSENVCIVLTHPHPSEIALTKAYFRDYIHALAEKDGADPLTYFAHPETENIITGFIVREKAQQSIGRVAGYRATDAVENIYVLFNDRLLERLQGINYVSPNVFLKSSFDSSSKLREQHPKLSGFLDDVSEALNTEAIAGVREIKHNGKVTIYGLTERPDGNSSNMIRGLLEIKKNASPDFYNLMLYLCKNAVVKPKKEKPAVIATCTRNVGHFQAFFIYYLRKTRNRGRPSLLHCTEQPPATGNLLGEMTRLIQNFFEKIKIEQNIHNMVLLTL